MCALLNCFSIIQGAQMQMLANVPANIGGNPFNLCGLNFTLCHAIVNCSGKSVLGPRKSITSQAKEDDWTGSTTIHLIVFLF